MGTLTEAIGVAEAARILEPLHGAAKLLIGVSGGPDSVALMGLAARVGVKGSLPPLVVATVDHGLAKQSAAVAQGVMVQAGALGLEAHRLHWDGDKPGTGIQEAARATRYGLLTALARRIGASHLVTAHTLDDQAETILFRLTRGSGPAGLAGMRPLTRRDGVLVCRPLLGVPKARLVATCRAAGWPYVEDPANTDPRFARARMRRLLPLLATEGLDAAALARFGARLARDEEALAEAAERCRAACLIEAGDTRRLFAAAMLDAPPAVLLRVLEAALTDFAVAGPPRLQRLETLAAALQRARVTGRTLRRTLHGACLTLDAGGRVELTPEGPRQRRTGALGRTGPRLTS